MATNLLEKLAELRSVTCEKMPTPELAVLARAVANLRRTDILQRALQVGETAPDFSFQLKQEEATSLAELLERGPVLLNFFRGFWCSYCQSELEAYQQLSKDLESLQCSYLAVSPQRPDEGAPLSWRTVFDQGNHIARDYGIVYSLTDDEVELFSRWGLRLDEINEAGNWELPLPAIYVIRPDRTIGYQFVDPDFRNRCCPGQLLDEIRYVSAGR